MGMKLTVYITNLNQVFRAWGGKSLTMNKQRWESEVINIALSSSGGNEIYITKINSLRKMGVNIE